MISFLHFLLQGCVPLGEKVDKTISSNYYYGQANKSKIYYYSTKPIGSPKELKDVDAASFRVLSEGWAKDKNAVYRAFRRYTSVDAPSFTVSAADSISSRSGMLVLKDKNHVYYIDSDNELTILQHADPNTFVCIDYNNPNRWAKDKNHVYCNWKIFDADPATFELLNESFAKDKNYLYAGYLEKTQKIQANTSQLVKVSSYYVRTETDLYYCDTEFAFSPISDTTDIKILFGSKWLKADGRLFFMGKPYSDMTIDIGSLEYIENGYLRDKSSIYFCRMYEDMLKPVREADLETFNPIGKHRFYAKDKNYVYHAGIIIEGANPKTFYYDEDKDYAYDGDKVYRDGKLLK